MRKLASLSLWGQLLLALLLSLAIQEPVEEPPAVRPPIPVGFVDCSTCEDGFDLLPCVRCEGEGQRPCLTCDQGGAGLYLLRPDRQPMLQLDENSVLYGLDVALLIVSLAERKGGAGPGQIPCNGGPDGAADYLRTDKEKTCKRCDNEWTLDCKSCKTGFFPCARCEGAKTERRACLDCQGKGHLPDPSLVKDDARGTCLWCEGRGTHPCTELETKYHIKPLGLDTCTLCVGKKKIGCRMCFGTKKDTCFLCDGVGKRKDYSGKTPKLKSCKECKGRGATKCLFCKGKGTTKCDSCQGEGVADIRCDSCSGESIIPCYGCFRGSSRSWDWSAGVLEAAGHFSAAGATLRIVHDRLPAEIKQRTAFEDAFGYDYILKRPTTEGELETARQKRAWSLAAKASQLESLKDR